MGAFKTCDRVLSGEMRIVRAPDTQPCYACGQRADVAVARGYRLAYACWEHAEELLEMGGVLVGRDLEDRPARPGG
ncbi:hypothetical protein [Haloarchaeobius sp. HME9146]|uniref:hypothetical protein n=1 Tax=Haloarchaeobius sp. HME9146 TaxID=2978732 RepID=UPI0021BF911A|nr:hypothetical protein [Haloarchaeobius sp. HME9146]MCT9098428.1 hypothetical protein [Haloarchaeobius sp. HME9146]